MYILVVDDESDDLEMVARTLQDEGEFQVFTAGDYEKGLAAFERHADNIDLAILDVALPGRSGVDLAKELLKRKPSLRILFISGHVGAAVVRLYGVDAGDDHFLRKPFDRKKLLERVRLALTSDKPLSLTLTA